VIMKSDIYMYIRRAGPLEVALYRYMRWRTNVSSILSVIQGRITLQGEEIEDKTTIFHVYIHGSGLGLLFFTEKTRIKSRVEFRQLPRVLVQRLSVHRVQVQEKHVECYARSS
jgi:hypothetical protein